MGSVENKVQRACMEYLTLKGHFPIRINTQGIPLATPRGMITMGGPRFRPSPSKGVSDIICVLKGGRTAAIEVKSKTGRVAPHQQEFLDKVAAHGGLALVVRSIQDLINAGI